MTDEYYYLVYFKGLGFYADKQSYEWQFTSDPDKAKRYKSKQGANERLEEGLLKAHRASGPFEKFTSYFADIEGGWIEEVEIKVNFLGRIGREIEVDDLEDGIRFDKKTGEWGAGKAKPNFKTKTPEEVVEEFDLKDTNKWKGFLLGAKNG